jgi:hypothetical protein
MFDITSWIGQSPYLVIFALLFLGDIGLPVPPRSNLLKNTLFFIKKYRIYLIA